MSSFLLTTIGTTGEVEPFLHLARGLRNAGQDVRVASHGMQAARFEGFDFVPASADFSVAEINAVLDDITRTAEPIRQFEILVDRLFLQDAEAQLARYRDAVKGVDFAVCHRFDYLGQAAVIEAGIRFGTFTLVPDVFPTMEAPPYPFPRIGKWLTKRAWAAVAENAAPLNDRVAAVLARLGLPERSLGIAGVDSGLLDMLAASRHLSDPRADWPPSVVMTGPWTGEEQRHTPDDVLAAFLSRHPRPVVVTFGSMGGSVKEETATILTEALARAEQPAIVQAGYQGLEGDSTGDILFVGYVPHDILFDHAACIVHHAGAGTTVAAARAGVPSVPVPHMFDQYYWAGMLHKRGAAPAPVFRRELTPKRLAARISEALRSAKMQDAARALGEKMRSEDGVGRAIEAMARVM